MNKAISYSILIPHLISRNRGEGWGKTVMSYPLGFRNRFASAPKRENIRIARNFKQRSVAKA